MQRKEPILVVAESVLLVVIQKLVKNNDVTLYELMIAEQGCNNPKSVCLNCYYTKYQKDKNLNAIEADIVDIYLNL